MENKDLTSLVGKTIKNVEWRPYTDFDEGSAQVDDGDILHITFTDGFYLICVGAYNEYWTGNSTNEYPTHLHTILGEPEGYNGKGMYEAQAKWENTTPQAGFPNASTLTFDGEKRHLHTSTLRFQAESIEHAKSLLNLDEVEYVKWVPNYKN